MLIRRTLLYLPAQVVGPVAQFVAIVAFTHLMAPEPYGVFTYVVATQDFVFLLSLSWWSTYTVRYFSGQANESGLRYKSSEGAILAGTLGVQIVASFLSLLLIWHLMTPALVAASIFYTVTRCLDIHLAERARAQHRVADYTFAASAGPVFGFALAILAGAFLSATPTVALASYGVAQAIVAVWAAARQDLSFTSFRADHRLVREALAFGLPLIAAGLAAWFATNAIRVLVDWKMGAAAMGLVAVGWNLGNRLMATTALSVTVAAFPLAVESLRRGAREEAFRQITRNGLLIFGIVLPAAVGLYLLCDPIIALVVAAPFRDMTSVVLPAALAAGLCRNVRTHVADQIFLLVERTVTVCNMAILEAVLVIGGCVAGLFVHGAEGAAYGSALGYMLAMVASFAWARLRAGLHIPLTEAGLVAAAAAVMAAVLLLLPGDTALPRIGAVGSIAGRILVGVFVYVGALLVLFPAITRHAVHRWRLFFAA